jgi:hypothetical protein
MQSSVSQAKYIYADAHQQNWVPKNLNSGFGAFRSCIQMPMLSQQNPFEVLRRTDRLQEHLKSIGYGLYEDDTECENPLYDIREVEFIVPQERQESTGVRSPAPRSLFIPAGFSFWALERLIKRRGATGFPVFMPLEKIGWGEERWGDCIPRFCNWWCKDESINIFWITPKEFVSPLLLDCFASYPRLDNYATCSVEFIFNEKCTWSCKHSSLLLYGYHIENIKTDHEVTPEALLQFFKDLLAPVIDRISSIEFNQYQYEFGRSTSSVLEMLSVIPTNDLGHSTLLDQKNDILRLRLRVCMAEEQFQELASFPFHPNVRLELVRSSRERYSQVLLQAKYLRHLLLPYDMLAINCEGKPFGSNRPFQSLTFCVTDELPSHQLMEFIAKNKTINSLAVRCFSGIDHHKSHCRILDMLRSPCVGRDSSVKEFTIELFGRSCQLRSLTTVVAQQFFDQWTCICFDWNKGFAQHSGLSSFRFAISDGRYPSREANAESKSGLMNSDTFSSKTRLDGL